MAQLKSIRLAAPLERSPEPLPAASRTAQTPASHLVWRTPRCQRGAMSEIHPQGGSTMSTNSIATGAAPTIKQDSARADSVARAPEVRDEDRPGLGRSGDRYEAVRQYSLGKILAVWAAAAIPMGVLAWIVAPWLSDRIGGRDPFIESLLICFIVGLLWQLVMVLFLVRREQGSTIQARMPIGMAAAAHTARILPSE